MIDILRFQESSVWGLVLHENEMVCEYTQQQVNKYLLWICGVNIGKHCTHVNTYSSGRIVPESSCGCQYNFLLRNKTVLVDVFVACICHFVLKVLNCPFL